MRPPRAAPPLLAVRPLWRTAATLYCWGVVKLALVAYCAVVPVGWVLARTRALWASLLDAIATLPFAVAGTVLAVGLVIAFNSGRLVLTGGWLIMVLAYTIRKLPFTVGATGAIVHQFDPSLEEASISLGVSPLRTLLFLVAPLKLGGIASPACPRLGHGRLRTLHDGHPLFGLGPWRTLTIIMFQALEGTGAGVAVAAASVPIAISILPVLAAYRLFGRHELASALSVARKGEGDVRPGFAKA